MILVDSNVLIARASPRDRLHAAAVADLRRLVGRELVLTSPVLTEVFFALPAAHLRARVVDLIRDFDMRPIEGEGTLWPATFAWLARYADHDPDFADALLAVASAGDARRKVWTYAAGFRTLWRRPDGSRIPLAVRPPPLPDPRHPI